MLYDSLRPPLDAVREHADSAMELYEYELAKTKPKSKYRKGEAVVDEDGFTLVTRGGAYGQTLGGGVGVASKKFQQSGQTTRDRKKKDSKEKDGFYAFQRAEKQRNRMYCCQENDLHADFLYARPDGTEEELGGRQGKGRKVKGIKAVQAVLGHVPSTYCTGFGIAKGRNFVDNIKKLPSGAQHCRCFLWTNQWEAPLLWTHWKQPVCWRC
jgi:hypothetical protein